MATRSDQEGADRQRLLAIQEIIESASCYFGARFRLGDLRDDLVSETACRIAVMLSEGREPLTGIDPAAADQSSDVRRFIFGIARNVARELSRQERRHVSDVQLSERASVTMNLAILEESPAARIELDEVVGQALGRLTELNDELRETLVAEEVRRNDYNDETVESLCQSCSVSMGKVKTMISDRENGKITEAAWRQRIHRLRERAKGALAGADLFTVSLLWALTFGAAIASGLTGGNAEPTASDETSIVETGGLDLLLASTQNGKPKKG